MDKICWLRFQLYIFLSQMASSGVIYTRYGKFVPGPQKDAGFLASGEEFSPGPETRLDLSELLCNKVLLKYKGDRESF